MAWHGMAWHGTALRTFCSSGCATPRHRATARSTGQHCFSRAGQGRAGQGRLEQSTFVPVQQKMAQAGWAEIGQSRTIDLAWAGLAHGLPGSARRPSLSTYLSWPHPHLSALVLLSLSCLLPGSPFYHSHFLFPLSTPPHSPTRQSRDSPG